MTPRVLRGGAYVSVRPFNPFPEIDPPRNYRRHVYIEPNGLTGHQLAAVAKPSRQRRKGPIVRFGGRVS